MIFRLCWDHAVAMELMLFDCATGTCCCLQLLCLGPFAVSHGPCTSIACGECCSFFTLVPQVAVLANHQNGRDTHMRQVLVYGPAGVAAPRLGDAGLFDSLEFNCYSTMR